MKKSLKRIIIILSSVLLVILILYISFCFYIKSLILNNFYSDGANISNNITNEVAKEINPRNNYRDEVENIPNKHLKENYNILFIPIVDFFNRKIFYTYSCTAYNEDELIFGSTQIPVTLTFQFNGFDFKIIDCYEPP